MLAQQHPAILNPVTLADIHSCPVCSEGLQAPGVHLAHQALHRALGDLAEEVIQGKKPDWSALEAAEREFSEKLVGKHQLIITGAEHASKG